MIRLIVYELKRKPSLAAVTCYKSKVGGGGGGGVCEVFFLFKKKLT